MRQPDPHRKGGPHDDVANNIRAQQQRDAAPSAAEVKAQHRSHLRSEGCQVCACEDPDRLRMIRVPRPICSNGQQPDKPFREVVMCDEHRRDGSTLARARLIQNARRDDADVVIIYACGATDTAAWTPPDGHTERPDVPGPDEFDGADPFRKVMIGGEPPTVPAIHAGHGRPCGAPIKEVVRLG